MTADLRERLRALADAYANDATMAPDAFAIAAYHMALDDAEKACAEVEERHGYNNNRTWPERGRSEGQDGAADCVAAVRALAEGL